MKTAYTDLDISITMDGALFFVLNIVFEKFSRAMPRHSHGNNSYELHYIPNGRGTVNIGSQTFEITPNTLYMTGPHVEHEQIPLPEDPMAEYCIYFKLQTRSHFPPQPGSVTAKFQDTPFWFGQDSQELLPLLQKIFFELEHKYTGYMAEVEALLSQCIVRTVRNYESGCPSTRHFAPSNLEDSKYLIVEESFLYEYETITMDKLASRLGLSIRQTERFLKKYYGKTFLQKKNDAKMAMAKILLNRSDLNISDIAEKLNYSSIQHFSYAFRRYYGVSATQYRKDSANH